MTLELNGINLSYPWLYDVSRGKIPGASFIRKFGAIDSIDTGTPASVWEYGVTSGAEMYTFSSNGVADIDTISSSSTSDTVVVKIEGLSSDGSEVVQEATLNGQNKVTLTTPLWRFNRAYNTNGTDLVGDVYVYVDGAITLGVPDDKTTVRGYISAGEGQTLQSVYTIPKDVTGYFMGLEASFTKGVGATAVSAILTGRTREYGKVFRTQDKFNLISVGSSSKVYNFPIPLPFLELTDFCPCAEVSASGVGVSWSYTILLIDN